jgi:hypothetical protein
MLVKNLLLLMEINRLKKQFKNLLLFMEINRLKKQVKISYCLWK